jgi:hypothetical protein
MRSDRHHQLIYDTSRRLIGAAVLLALCIGACFAFWWVWRDITYWSRSAAVAYKNSTLKECVRIAVADWPGVSATLDGPSIVLRVSNQEAVVIKETPTPNVARIVVSGHSSSVSHLGPPSEELAAATLRELTSRISVRCGGA